MSDPPSGHRDAAGCDTGHRSQVTGDWMEKVTVEKVTDHRPHMRPCSTGRVTRRMFSVSRLFM